MSEFTTISPARRTVKQRLVALVTAVAFFFQTSMPAFAAAIQSAEIEAYLNLAAEFEKLLNNDRYQFDGAHYLALSAPQDAMYLDDFYKEVKEKYDFSIGGAKFVPIAVGDITTFVPVYSEYKYVGTDIVQSRYVRDQIYKILGRHIITAAEYPRYNNESEQINDLFNNAISYIASNPNARVGQALNMEPANNNLAKDMIWPELHTISGEQVLVPVVYLTSTTISQYKVDEHKIGFGGLVDFNNLTIDHVDVHLGRHAFLKTAQDLTLNSGGIMASGDAQLLVGGLLKNASGQIVANGDLNIGAHRIDSQTILHRYDIGGIQGTRYGDISILNAAGDLLLRSYSDISLYGSNIQSGGDITLVADGNILIGAQVLTSGQNGTRDGWKTEESSVDYLISKLTAEDTIQIMAAGGVQINAAEIVSNQGHIEILAGLGITIEDELSSVNEVKKYKRKKKDIDISAYETVAIRSVLDAGKGVRIHSDAGDITLKAVDISSTEGTNVSASLGKLNLLVTKETDHYSYHSVSKRLFTTRTVSEGHTIENVVHNTIVGGLSAEALYGVHVEYEGDPSLSLDEQIEVLGAMPGLEWLASVRQDHPDAQWDEVIAKYEEWKDVNTTLSPAVMAVIAIAVAIATSGAASTLAGTLTQSLATASGGLISGSAVGITQAALAAGMVSLTSQATLALANGAVNGDIGKALEELASSETLKNMAVAMVTAGAISAIDSAFFTADSQEVVKSGQEAADKVLQEGGGVVKAEAARKAVLDMHTHLSLGEQVGQAVVNSAVQAGVNVVINGEGSSDFEQLFVQSLMQNAINQLGQEMSSRIGKSWDIEGGDPLDSAVKYILHAGAGCVIGIATAANNDDQSEDDGCKYGALGEVSGELIGSAYKALTKDEVLQAQDAIQGFMEGDEAYVLELQSQGLSDAEVIAKLQVKYPQIATYATSIEQMKQNGVDIARLGAALSAFAAGASEAGVNLAADTGQNAAEHNALFLLAAIPLILKAIDVVITANDAYKTYKEISEIYENKGKDAGDEALANFIAEYAGDKLVEKLVEKMIPGGTIANKISQMLPEDIAKELNKLEFDKLDEDLYIDAAKESGKFEDEAVEYLNRQLKKDKPLMELSGGHKTAKSEIERLSTQYKFEGDLIIGPNDGKYRDSGVWTLDGRPILESANANGSKRYIYIDDRGIQQDVKSPFSTTIQENRRVHQNAVDDTAIKLEANNLTVHHEVSIRAPDGTLARTDMSLQGEEFGSISVPPGYKVYDRNGKELDHIQLDDKGRALLEMKTGNAVESDNQVKVYDACQMGTGSACGLNAKSAFDYDKYAPTAVYIIRPE